MDKKQYLSLMKFPPEWITSGMYPDDLWEIQRQGYEPGHENSPEHDRNGAFHWWLKTSPKKALLLKLVTLSFLDPDQIMAADVRSYIRKCKYADAQVIGEIERREIT